MKLSTIGALVFIAIFGVSFAATSDQGTSIHAHSTTVEPSMTRTYRKKSAPDDAFCDSKEGLQHPSCHGGADACIPNKCKPPRERCVRDEHEESGYTCRCPKDTIGQECEFPGPCVSQPCVNNGVCVQVDDTGTYICNCPKKFVGYFCEYANPCLDNPCQNGGSCIVDDSTGSFTCNCSKGFIGTNCNNSDPCTNNPCEHEGFCTTDSIGNALCICQDGYRGLRCEIPVTNCSGNVCHEGSCKMVQGKVQCSCGDKYSGEYCETKVTCADNPCEHGGTCSPDGDFYQCSCMPGYSGVRCEINELPCGQDIYSNFNEATQYPNKVCMKEKCFCRLGFTGSRCEEEAKACNQIDCLNGGSCVQKGRKFECRCGLEYEGENCDKRKDTNTIVRLPDKKHFCKVLNTIGERGGCNKCSATKENCDGCCREKETSCIANCKRLEQFCEKCKNNPGTCHNGTGGKFERKCENAGSCDKSCQTEATSCIGSCTSTAGLTNCPNVYFCPKLPKDKQEGPVQRGGTVEGYQCRAMNLPSGRIECVYEHVSADKNEYHSYIMFPRIHFAGKVQIDPPTLNNVFSNFDIDTFSSVDTLVTDVDWNPLGSGAFRFADVSVTRVCYQKGLCQYLQHDEPLVGSSVKGQASGKVAAKIVDLDIEVQGRLSEIYGLSIQFGKYFKGDMEVASFQSLWYNMISVPNNDYGQASRLQSVINNVQFLAGRTDSNFVNYLKKNIGPNRKLSICFNIDMTAEQPGSNFSFSRIVGSIGLAGEKAPDFFDHGRMLRPLPATNLLSYVPFTIDEGERKILLDLGNSLAIGRDGFVLPDVGEIVLGIYHGPTDGIDVPNCLSEFRWISRIYYDEYGGYRYTSGIYVVDVPDRLKGKLNRQFVLAKTDEGGKCLAVYLAENKNGINVRSLSRFVFRAQPEEVVQGELFVTIFGETEENLDPTKVDLNLVNASSVITPDYVHGPKQPFGLFQRSHGSSIYDFYLYAMENPKNIRKTIDGQVYTMQYTFDGYPLIPDRNKALNSAICVHVYDDVNTEVKTTWVTTIYPIFKVYANLFPVMRSFVDLGDYNSVVHKKCHIITAMSLDFQDPQFMPVTRDLSPKKTEVVLRWLDEGKPQFGLTYEENLTKEHLLQMLQIALELEHSTIPIYLNGYLSIKPGQNMEVKSLLHGIIVEEMFHLAQVANIMNGLGGRPYLLGNNFVPSYPTQLPGGCRPNMIATINKISTQQVHDVYMEIEEPSSVLKERDLVALINQITNASLQQEISSGTEDPGGYPGECREALDLFPLPNRKLTQAKHDTIGDFYMSVVYILGQLSICGKKDIFTGKTQQLTWSDPRLLKEVHNYDQALEGIKAIVEQGEGASPYNPLQQNEYSIQLAHYFKFSSIYHGREIATFNVTHENVLNSTSQECHEDYVYTGDKIPLFQNGVWPVVKDPRMSKYKPDSQAYKNAQAFNDMYKTLLETLQDVFDGHVGRFDDTFGLMKSLIVYGNRVVQTPIDEDGDAQIGPNAGPTYFN